MYQYTFAERFTRSSELHSDRSEVPGGTSAVAKLAVGTMIQTPRGEVPVEYLQAGDLIMARGLGPVRLAEIGTEILSDTELRTHPELCPILIPRDALGLDLPTRDLLVAPTQRIPVRAASDGGLGHRLVAARDLIGRAAGVCVDEDARSVAGVEYFALVLEHPAMIWADGLPVECPGLAEPAEGEIAAPGPGTEMLV